MRRIIVLLLPLLSVAAGVTFRGVSVGSVENAQVGGGPVEARCTELGSACIVSEPFNTNNYVSSGGHCDPADSEGQNAKEALVALDVCSSDNVPIATSVADVDLPTGTSVISYVMRAGVGSNKTYDNGTSTSHKRFCMRHYRKHSTNFADMGVCGADKGMEFMSTGPTAIQFNGYSTDGRMLLWNAPDWSEGGDVNYILSPQIDTLDCTDNWCRYELCISSGSGNIRSGTDITMEAYVTQVGVANPISASASHYVGNFVNSIAEVWPYLTLRHNPPINYTCQNLSIDDWGYSYYTHIMEAGWTTNSGQTIGAAVEVEGQ